MENAKRIGGMCALAVALGVGMAVANTPAVASAAPDDTGKGSSSGDSSPSNSSKHSDSTEKRDDTNGHRRAPKKADESVASSSDSSTEQPSTRKRGGSESRPGANSASVKTRPKPAVVEAADADISAHDNSVDSAAASVSSTAATPAIAPRSRTSVAVTPADPVSRMVTTLVNAAVSPFAGSAPNRSPVQNPAAFTLLAFARREFEPTTTVDRPADAVSTSAVDPGFISSTHGFFGLFSVTSAADPDDNHYVAFVLRTPFFTNVLTSGTDPEDNLGFGSASIGVAGHTVNTFISPFLNFSIAIPIEDPFAELFTELVRLGF
jgi:hypothetical protein